MNSNELTKESISYEKACEVAHFDDISRIEREYDELGCYDERGTNRCVGHFKFSRYNGVLCEFSYDKGEFKQSAAVEKAVAYCWVVLRDLELTGKYFSPVKGLDYVDTLKPNSKTKNQYVQYDVYGTSIRGVIILM